MQFHKIRRLNSDWNLFFRSCILWHSKTLSSWCHILNQIIIRWWNSTSKTHSHSAHFEVILSRDDHVIFSRLYIAILTLFLSLFKMRETQLVEKRKLRKLEQKIKSKEKTISRLKKSIQQNCQCSICDSKNTIYIYCTTCATFPICKTHFCSIPLTRLCPLCNQRTISRRWSMTVPNLL